MIKHISYVVLAAQILIGLTSAQDLSELPQCAVNPSSSTFMLVSIIDAFP